MNSTWRQRLYGLLLLAAVSPCATLAAPGDTLFSDNFDDGTLAPWTTTNTQRAGVQSAPQVFSSPAFGAYTRFDPVTVTGPTFNAAVPAAELSIWVRRGSDAFGALISEDTDVNEDFVIEYRRADGSWGLIALYEGDGVNGQIYTDTFALPPDALHGALALRVRQTGGSGFSYDFWHFDDVVVTEVAPAPPLAVGRCDDFEQGLSNWTITAGSGSAGTSGATFSSPSTALFTNGGTVSVTSRVIDTSVPGFSDLTLWVRRGANAFSERPEGNEDLNIEYLDDAGNWVVLDNFSGGGSQGQIFLRRYTLPVAARHANFRLRFRQLGGSGAVFDFWHIDDVCFETLPLPSLQITKLAQTLSDPVNGTSNPMSIPGAIVQYTITVSNQGPGTVDADSLRITDAMPPGTELFVATGGGDPITFTDGTVASGLGFSYVTDVAFSDQPGGSPVGYTPVPDADGFDPAVTGFVVSPSGTMNGATGGNNPSFTIRFRVRLR